MQKQSSGAGGQGWVRGCGESMAVTCKVEQGGLEQAEGHRQTIAIHVCMCFVFFFFFSLFFIFFFWKGCGGLAVFAEQRAAKEAESIVGNL